MLEDGDIKKYAWLQDELMIADALTKSKSDKIGLNDLLEKNRLNCVMTEKYHVAFDDGEFKIVGEMLRRKLLPKPKIPMKKKKRNE